MIERITFLWFHKVSQIYRTCFLILKIRFNVIFQFSFQIAWKISGLFYYRTLKIRKPVISGIIRCVIWPDILIVKLLQCRSRNNLSVQQTSDIIFCHFQITIYCDIKFFLRWTISEHSLIQTFKYTCSNQRWNLCIRNFNLCGTNGQVFIACRIRSPCLQCGHISLNVIVHLCHCGITTITATGFSRNVSKNILRNRTQDLFVTELVTVDIWSIQKMAEIKWCCKFI